MSRAMRACETLVLASGQGELHISESLLRQMFSAWPVHLPQTPPSVAWMSLSHPGVGVLVLVVPHSPRPSPEHCDSPEIWFSPRHPLCSLRTKQPRGGNWSLGIGCVGKRYSSSEVVSSGGVVPKMMFSTTRGGVLATSRVLATEQNVTGEDGISGISSLAEGVSSQGSSYVRCNEESAGGGGDISCRKREFCERCCRAASRCICRLITTQVNNKTKIIILQHPLENHHHLGTARIAVVGLRNVELISVPEGDEMISCRLRPKVPGSKRQIAGRGGKKSQFLAAQAEASKKLPRKRSAEPKRQTEATIRVKQETESPNMRVTSDNPVMKMATLGSKQVQQDVRSIAVPSWIKLQPDAGLLFPSEHAVDLCPGGSEFDSEDSDLSKNDNSNTVSAHRPPSQLIVLDGTWSKAKRIFYENPWLHSLPHYRLPPNDGASRYGIIRREPKVGCVSTIESIVFALRVWEPETEGLDSLLDVFDLMMEDQKICMGEKYAVLEEKVRRGLSRKSGTSK